jgi:glyoxylase-like metal-dependent hydrolase (beta-lactamase superfamily II)
LEEIELTTKRNAQPPGLYHLALGDILVTAVNDGIFQASFDLIAGIDPKECERIESAAFRAVPPKMTMNTFLLQIDGHVALIDAGCGVSMGPTLGMTLRNLAAIGVTPADIDSILMTHLHPDHMNGLIDGDGRAIFPRAELVVNEAELEFFTNKDSIARAPEEARGFFAEARAATDPYRDRIRTVKNGPVLPGVSALTLPGHTPGHTAWMVESSGDSVLIWGDIVHMPAVQLAAPEAGTILDIDRAQAVATRRRTLDIAIADRQRVAGIHMDFPAFGHIIRAGDGFAFVPQVWSAVL